MRLSLLRIAQSWLWGSQTAVRLKQLIFVVVWTVSRIILGWSVGKIIILILCFWVSTFKNNIDHWDKETGAISALPIHNKNSAINGLLPFLFDFNIMATVCSETSYRSWYNRDTFLGNRWNDSQTLIKNFYVVETLHQTLFWGPNWQILLEVTSL